MISSGAAFLGALVPLLPAALLPSFRWASIAAALVTLAFLGVGLARSLTGSIVKWCLGLVAGGALLSIIGTWLKIAG
jgi:VIT1/CCC1 family predicted Fe2+/Mn2+ transporter